MLNPSYTFVCQAAHLCAAGFLMLAAVHLWGPAAELPMLYGGIALAALKEFWCDLHFETPEISGGIKGGVIDFSFYVLGLLLAALVLAL
jgi:hypothetical protein